MVGWSVGWAAYIWNTGATTSSITVSPLSTTTYTVNGKSVAGCPGTPVTVVVTVAATLSVTVTPGTPAICYGDSITLSAGGAATYTWKPSLGLSCTTCSNPVADPLVTSTYTVYGASGGCSDSAEVTLTVNPTPTVSIAITGISPAICPGDSIGMVASGANSYSWSPAGGLNCTSCATVSASPSATSSYTVTGTDVGGCTATASQVITVYPAPTMTLTAVSSSVCLGDSVQITASGVSTYIWSPPSGLNKTTGANVNAGPSTTTTYTVTGTGVGGCKIKDSIAVTVNALPVVTASVASAICIGDSVTVKASGANTYTWGAATGLSATTGDSVKASPAGTTTYTVSGTSLAGCVNTATVAVTVTPTPTVSVTPASGGICPGDSVTLKASGGATYSWNTGATADSVRVSPSSATTYTVTAYNGKCSATGTASINVGVISVSVSATSSTLCSGNSTTLTASGALLYTWKPGTGLSATSGTSVNANPGTTQTYTVIGTSGSGCSDSTSTVITVNPTPTVSITPAAGVVCFGTGGTTLSSSGATTYSWSPSTGISNPTDSVVTANPSSSQTYTITGISSAGCNATATVSVSIDQPIITATATSPSICVGGSTTINANGGTTYTWYPSAGLTSTSGSTITADSNASGSYWVVGTDAQGCKDSANVNITVNTLPAVTVTASDSNICAGNSAVLNASGANTYSWSPSIGLIVTTGATITANPASTQTYIVTGTSIAGCISTAQVIINVNTSPAITIALSGNDTLCPGSSVTMTASGATTYSWSPSAGLSATTGASVSATPVTDPVIYTVIGKNGTCSDSAKQALYLYPALAVTASPGDSICAGKAATVSVTASGGKPGYTYSWTNLPGTGPGPYTVNPSSPTTYCATVKDQCNSTSTQCVTIYALPAPKAIFWPAPDTIMGGQFVTFIDSSTGATNWNWTFGDDHTSSMQFPYNQYIAPGNYLVTLVVSNVVGCADTATDTVYVTEGVYIPNIFTPNNDGQNDVFHITAGGMKAFNIEIFNRWGERVFESNSAGIEWDGRSMTGVEESDGTYYYILKATDFAGKTYNIDGYVQLVRN